MPCQLISLLRECVSKKMRNTVKRSKGMVLVMRSRCNKEGTKKHM
jgi:hypothetical protein